MPAVDDGAKPRDEHLPKNLCLSQCHVSSKKNRRVKVSFNINSTCAFVNSLGVARQGVNWFPKGHPVLNLTIDIYFRLKVPVYDQRGVLT